MKGRFLSGDWVAAPVRWLVCVFAARSNSPSFQRLQRSAKAVGSAGAGRTLRNPSVVAAGDDRSIANNGLSPRPRNVVAIMARPPKGGGARLVGLPGNVTEIGHGPGLALIHTARSFHNGEHRDPLTERDNLLPAGKVIEIVIEPAADVDNVHAGNVVRRDVKPANIAFERSGSSGNSTSFGVAHITEANRQC